MQRIFRLFLIWRILLFLPLIAGSYLLVAREGYAFLNPWANFDGIHYLSIAQNGYVSQAAFFPLFPLLIRFFAEIIAGQYFLSGFLFANISFLLSLYFLYKLLLVDYSPKQSRETLYFLILFPTAFFFGALYSESLFLLLLVLSFYFGRKGKWLCSIIFASLLVSTRLVGIFILPALIYEYYVQKKKFNPGFFVIPVGLIIYSFFNYLKWGNAFYFIKAHGELANSRSVESVILFPQTMYRYLKILGQLPPSQYEWWIATLELSSFILVSVLLYFAWKKRVRLSYLIFSALAFLLPASSGTFTGLPRYVVILFPIYIVLASIKDRGSNIASLIISSILLFILLMFFLRGYFVA